MHNIYIWSEIKVLEMPVKGRRRLRPMQPLLEDEEEVIRVFLKVVLRPGHFKQSLDI